MKIEIEALNKSARAVHGADISILVARAVAFGHDDNLILVRGRNHAQAAFDLIRVIGRGAKIGTAETTLFMSSKKVRYSTVSF